MGERGGTELEIDRYPSYQLPKANAIFLFDDHTTLVPITKTAYLRTGADATCFQISTFRFSPSQAGPVYPSLRASSVSEMLLMKFDLLT